MADSKRSTPHPTPTPRPGKVEGRPTITRAEADAHIAATEALLTSRGVNQTLLQKLLGLIKGAFDSHVEG